MDEKLIVVVDDDPEIIKLMSVALKDEGFDVKGFSCAEELFGFMEKEKPGLILLDVTLPRLNGFEICKILKSNDRFSSIPVIILSGRSGEADKVFGLDAGSDDYIVKPCTINEIKARVRAVLRRYSKDNGEKKIYIGGDKVIMDLERHEVTVDGKKIDLTQVEFKVLERLASRKNFAFSRKNILEFLWGEEKVVVARTIDVHVRHLRKKLGDAEKYIKNVRGIGYKLEEEE
ncbi:MAG: response regulator transcription factor [Candidatus Omnitrophota bacterium]|jgi:two-component system phosphate regulon response regulator PhoB/two-component system alkaline phosphatase synthesis response regulator PhoP